MCLVTFYFHPNIGELFTQFELGSSNPRTQRHAGSNRRINQVKRVKPRLTDAGDNLHRAACRRGDRWKLTMRHFRDRPGLTGPDLQFTHG